VESAGGRAVRSRRSGRGSGVGVGVVYPDQGREEEEEEDEEKPKTRTRHEGDPERVATWLGVWVAWRRRNRGGFPPSPILSPLYLSLPSGPAQSCLVHPAFIIFIYFCSWAIGLFLVLLGKKN